MHMHMHMHVRIHIYARSTIIHLQHAVLEHRLPVTTMTAPQQHLLTSARLSGRCCAPCAYTYTATPSLLPACCNSSSSPKWCRVCLCICFFWCFQGTRVAACSLCQLSMMVVPVQMQLVTLTMTGALICGATASPMCPTHMMTTPSTARVTLQQQQAVTLIVNHQHLADEGTQLLFLLVLRVAAPLLLMLHSRSITALLSRWIQLLLVVPVLMLTHHHQCQCQSLQARV